MTDPDTSVVCNLDEVKEYRRRYHPTPTPKGVARSSNRSVNPELAEGSPADIKVLLHYTLTPRAVPLKTGEEIITPISSLKIPHFNSNRGELLQTPDRMFTDIKPRRGDRVIVSIVPTDKKNSYKASEMPHFSSNRE